MGQPPHPPQPPPSRDGNPEQEGGRPPGRFTSRLLNRLLVPYALLIVAAFSIAGWFFLRTAVSSLDESLSTRLTGYASVVAGELKPDYLARLQPGDESTRLYRILISQLSGYLAGTGVEDVFVVDRQGRVILDVDEEIPIGAEYHKLKLDTVELDRVWGGETTASILYEDDEGALYKSAYAPVLNSDGNVIAVAGVEAGAGFLSTVHHLRQNVLYLVLAAITMSVVISLVVSRSIVGPVGRLVSAFSKMQKEGSYPTVEVTTHDEVGYLTESFNAMSRRLEEKDAELTRLYQIEKERAERIQGLSDLMLDGIPNGVIAVNLSGRVLLCNPAAARIMPIAGYPFPDTGIPPLAEEALGKGNPVGTALLHSLKDQKLTLHTDVRWMHPDGDERVLGISAFPLSDRSGQQVGAMSIFSDRTALSQLHDQVQIAERLAALGELSAGIAHEIRNPLGAIRGFVELLGRKVDDPSALRTIESILREVGVLNHIVTDFLAFAREPSLNPETIDAEKLLTDARSLAIPEGSKSPVTVTLEVEPGLPPLYVDPAQVRQALINIIQNAVVVMGEDGGEILLTAGRERGGVAFQVADTGPGIPDEVRDKMFNPFFTTRAEGTGLGLPIANKVVEGHGGEIRVENRKQRGARFTLWFPGIDANKQLSPDTRVTDTP
ncbi:MAG: ATP-binding protein [Leptospirillia bacterium]